MHSWESASSGSALQSRSQRPGNAASSQLTEGAALPPPLDLAPAVEPPAAAARAPTDDPPTSTAPPLELDALDDVPARELPPSPPRLTPPQATIKTVANSHFTSMNARVARAVDGEQVSQSS
jgi:hypothetical protein